MPALSLRPLRVVILWQAIATVMLAVPSGWLAGLHGAISAVLGGLVGILAASAFALMVSLHKDSSAMSTLVSALKAEAVKITTMIALLLLVLATYEEVVMTGFIGSFIISVMILGMAFFVRDTQS